MRPAYRRAGILLAKLTLLALVIWGGHRTISAAWNDLDQHGWQFSRLQPTWLLLAGLLYLISQIPSAWFWHGVLNAMGQRVEWLRAMRAHYIGHLGKYVPGKALVVIMRAALIGQPLVKTGLAVVAVFYETFTTMAVGAVVATIILLITHQQQVWLIAGALGLAIVVGLPTLPPIFIRILRLMRMAPANSGNCQPIKLSAGLLLRGWATIGIGWFLAGASPWATVRAIGVDSTNLTDLPLDTATVALAVALGFVSMLPAGIGVRDVVLLQLLAPRLEQLMPQQGELLALIAVIVLRLTWLAAEAAVSLVLYPLGRILRDNQRVN